MTDIEKLIEDLEQALGKAEITEEGTELVRVMS